MAAGGRRGRGARGGGAFGGSRSQRGSVTCTDFVCQRKVRYTFGYAVANVLPLTLIFTTPRTTLWNDDGSLSAGEFAGFIFVLALAWLFHWLVQNSDPGFLTDIVLPDDAVLYSSDAMSAYKWRHEWGDEDDGTWANGVKLIMEAQEKFPGKPKKSGTKPGDGGHAKYRDEESDAGSSDYDEDGSSDGGKKSQPENEFDQVEIPLHDGDALGANVDGDGDDEEEHAGLLNSRSHFVKDTKHPDLPYRAIYCKQARRWVATYDHYCMILGTPIGERNHGRFWWFLFAQSMAICYGIGFVHGGFHDTLVGSWYTENAHALWTAITLYLLLLFVGGLLVFHTYLGCSNTTTYEFMSSDEIDYLQGTKDFDLPYSNGIRNNLRVFCFNDGLFHKAFRTSWQPTQWGRPADIIRDSDDWWENMWENKYWSCC